MQTWQKFFCWKSKAKIFIPLIVCLNWEKVGLLEKDFDLISVGNVSIDTIKIQGNGGKHVVPGGSAAAVLTAASAFNLRTGLVSKVGEDFPDEWLLDLAERGIDIRGVKRQKASCRFELVYDENGALKNFDEIFNCEYDLNVKDIPEEYLSSRHFHISAAHPSNQSKFIKAIGEINHGSTVSLTLWPSYEKEYGETFVNLLDKVDILFCNNFEAKILAKDDNIYDAVKKVKKFGPKIIVLTKGAKGSAIYYKNDFFLFPALKANIVDRTGCGDSFAGGFLANYLIGSDIEKAGWAGTALASFTISKYGSWLPKEASNGKVLERIERARNYYEKGLKQKVSLMEFF